jgi:hypothetical protein
MQCNGIQKDEKRTIQIKGMKKWGRKREESRKGNNGVTLEVNELH